jgi:hypothetical protein
MKMSILQRFHWLITISLALLLLVETFFFLKSFLDYKTYKTGRPQGVEISLSKDLPVFGLNSSTPVFTLPAGTVVQGSSPCGLSTLGKYYGFDYLLIIHSKKPLEIDVEKSSDEWSHKYSFTPNDDGGS